MDTIYEISHNMPIVLTLGILCDKVYVNNRMR